MQPIADVTSEEWRQYARSILADSSTPLVLFEFQIDLLREDQAVKDQYKKYIESNPQSRAYFAFHHIMRFDAIAVDPWKIRYGKGPIKVLEFKSCRRDFTADRKWERYLPYCTQFAFLAPEGAIKPEELPHDVGLFVPKTIEYKYTYDDYQDPPRHKAGDVYKTCVEPRKEKQWFRHEVTPERRAVIQKRVMTRSLAFMVHHQREYEKAVFEKNPDLLEITHAYHDYETEEPAS